MQDTEELDTPNGHKVLIRGYVSGLVDQQVKKAMLSGMKVEAPLSEVDNELEKASQTVAIDLASQVDADAKLLELMVLAVDGDNGDVYNKLMNLPKADVDVVLAKVKELQGEGNVDPKASATPSSSSSTS